MIEINQDQNLSYHKKDLIRTFFKESLMTSYQILDVSRALNNFGDEANARMMIDMFAEARNFPQLVENYHKEVMLIKLRGDWESLLCCFDYVTSYDITKLIKEMREEADKQNKQKVIHLYLIFLRKCSILHRELEDYLQKPVASPDLKKYAEECMKELKYEDVKIEREGKSDASCAGCSIF